MIHGDNVALCPGTHLGPYETAAQIGAGGMGEVYRATDTHLDLVAEVAHRVDDAWLGDRGFLDVAHRVLDEVQHPFDLHVQPRILVQPGFHLRSAEDRRFAICEPC